ncbi:MAG TPA: hypothetical protein VFP65_12770 [Anaeromyxobacteraceae bacterium]|nr:hypothetical protein [Anaeromyxobacteraceae bacterium]
MKIGFVLDADPAPHRSDLVRSVGALLHDFGADVELIPAGARQQGSAARHLDVLAGDTPGALAAAGRLHHAGESFVDPYPAIAALRDRKSTLDKLAAVGLPVARVHARARPSHVLDCMGGQVFGALHGGPERRDIPVTIGASLRYIGIEAGRVLGVSLFTLELVGDAESLAVMNVRPFPCLRGVPDSALRLADYLYAAAERSATRVSPAHGTTPHM